MKKETVIRAIEAEKLIVIVRGIPHDALIPMAQAMYDGGIRLLEITYSANGAVSDEDTAAAIRSLSTHFAGRMHIGAGTVLTEEQVRLTAEAGGEFIISPDSAPAVITATNRFGLVSIPGALTPTEIQAAHKAGADFVKLFPVTNMGPAYVKAVTAPLSHIRLLAVGGVDEHNMADYLAVGVKGFGIGSNIVSKMLVTEGRFDEITARARAYVAAVGGAV